MSSTGTPEGTRLWTPSSEAIASSRLQDYLNWHRERGRDFKSYADLHAYSTRDIGAFWQSIWDYFGVSGSSDARVPVEGHMPDVRWFPGAELNYAEHALKKRDDGLAVIFRNESGERRTLSYRELADQVARARAGLVRLGVKEGDRVAALAPNCPETLITFLAAASLGAIFSSCSPEFGVGSVLDRFRQIEPRVLVAVEGYTYGGKYFDRSAELARIRGELPSLGATVLIGAEPKAGMLAWSELVAVAANLEFTSVPFEHPLWILYSSGTTGLPKAIVHGHGGILLEHLKVLALHSDIREGDRFFWYTTTGWMMYNYLVSGLLLGATLVLYDGSPAHPDLFALWKLAEEEGVDYFGASAPYLLACKKAGIVPKSRHRLDKLRGLGTTGAPLPADGFAWVYENVSSDLLLASVSGGTDVCTAFLLSCPILPVHAGELQVAGLGAKVEAFDEAGHPAPMGEVGELVLTQPLPSMPIYFWNDPGSVRRLESYFAKFPGVWRHGDWVKTTPNGGFVISGRSDSTLNRGGVRMGTSEFYRVVEALPEIADSLVVDTGSLDDATGKLWLFVALKPGFTLDEKLTLRLKAAIRSELSPRHVPDEIRAVRVVPRTLNGKKLEVPVKKILLGIPVDRAASRDTLLDPTALDAFEGLS